LWTLEAGDWPRIYNVVMAKLTTKAARVKEQGNKRLTRPPYKADQLCSEAPKLTTMTITEFASLELIAPHNLANPDPLLVKLLGRGADQQSAWSCFDLSFYTNDSSPSEIYLIAGWRDVPAHERWIASNRNQELMVKLGRFLKVRWMVDLNLDFNTVPTEKQIIVCEKYEPQSEADKLGGDKEEKEREAELQKGSRTDVEWVGAGKDLDPKAEGDFYKFTCCANRWKDKIVASATKHKEVIVLKKLDVKAIGKKL